LRGNESDEARFDKAVAARPIFAVRAQKAFDVFGVDQRLQRFGKNGRFP
jgi:hypothetical protein